MIEAPLFPGLWQCPDYQEPLNDAPPYQFKCRGMEMTPEACDAIDRELNRRWAERN